MWFEGLENLLEENEVSENEKNLKIIQNNINKVDFQSMIYEVRGVSWNEFKESVIKGIDIEENIIKSSMNGCGRNNGECVQVNIDDNFHLEVIKNLNGSFGKAQFYLVNRGYNEKN